MYEFLFFDIVASQLVQFEIVGFQKATKNMGRLPMSSWFSLSCLVRFDCGKSIEWGHCLNYCRQKRGTSRPFTTRFLELRSDLKVSKKDVTSRNVEIKGVWRVRTELFYI